MLSNMFLILDDAGKTFCNNAESIFTLIGWVVMILQIAIPIIIVVLGMMDLGKAVMAGDEKEIKEAQKMLIKRVIYGVLVFFVVTIVKTVFGLIGSTTTSSDCFKCATNPTACSINLTPETKKE